MVKINFYHNIIFAALGPEAAYNGKLQLATSFVLRHELRSLKSRDSWPLQS